jgi:large subunit ribosomal protein L4e
MKTKVYNKSGKEGKEIELPKNFSSRVRKDIVQKVFEAQKREQPYGVMPGAGAGYSASGISRKKRHEWKVTYGKGISRIPRKIMSRHGSSFNWVGATTTNTRGGRTAHPPRTEKNQFRKINKKELEVAMNSCFSASVNPTWLEKTYKTKGFKGAVVVGEDLLKSKTKELIEFLNNVFGELADYALKKKCRRSGKGKSRGRKYRTSAGLVLVIGNKEEMKRKGIEVVKVGDLAINDLTLNGVPGRMIIYSEEAIKEIKEKWKE